MIEKKSNKKALKDTMMEKSLKLKEKSQAIVENTLQRHGRTLAVGPVYNIETKFEHRFHRFSQIDLK